jgi:hypothetical protein
MNEINQEIPTLIQRACEARTEAELACEFDKSLKYYDAISHYDQAVSIIDGILEQVSSEGSAWEKLIVFRQTYSDRMVRCF